jgi:pimeloyl-ACP methyl ester carboxylesterase
MRSWDALGIQQFAMYVMDFGAPVGYRLVLKYGKRLSGIVAQNAPAYSEGGTLPWWATLAAYWENGSADHRKAARRYLTEDSIKGQYLVGVRDPSLIDPDNWLIDQVLLDRPGVDEIMLDMLYDIRNNVPTFIAMQEYFRMEQPPALIVTGANDEDLP